METQDAIQEISIRTGDVFFHECGPTPRQAVEEIVESPSLEDVNNSADQSCEQPDLCWPFSEQVDDQMFST